MEKEAAYRAMKREIEIQGVKDKISAGMFPEARIQGTELHLVFDDGTIFIVTES